jgi:hypothetical protein
MLILLAAVLPGLLRAQTTGNGEQAATFLAAARTGTARYQDRDAAIADGYRAIGPDAPGMGQHWVNPALVLGGRFDAARPQVLTYIMVGGRAQLVGVAYAIPTSGGRGAPNDPAGESAWHYHAHTVDEESFLPDHHHAGEEPGSDTRVAVMHAWAWSVNPAGAFEPDNWALPFARMGMTPPPGAGSDEGKALSLASVGKPFYQHLLSDLCGRDSVSAAATAAALENRASLIGGWAEGRRGRALTALEGAWLRSQWQALWEDIGRAAPALGSRLAALDRSDPR